MSLINEQQSLTDPSSNAQQPSTPSAESTSQSGELPNTIVQTVDLTAVDEVENYTVDEVVEFTVAYCKENSINSHVEILRCFQQKMVTGRALDVKSVSEATEGETNFIIIDRSNLINTSFDEIMFLAEYRRTLQVQFYGEVCTIYFLMEFILQLFNVILLIYFFVFIHLPRWLKIMEVQERNSFAWSLVKSRKSSLIMD